MSFSILYEDSEAGGTRPATLTPPACFADLNLDQVVTAITAGREDYDLEPFFYDPLRSLDAIAYRHEVLRDLEDRALLLHIRSFVQGMRVIAGRLARSESVHYPHEKQRWFLDGAHLYCQSVDSLARHLTGANVQSRGFRRLREYLTSYTQSAEFVSLFEETHRLLGDLSTIRYALCIEGARIEVRRYESEGDYGAEVLRTFEKFKQGGVRDYQFTFRDTSELNHVEAAIVDRVAWLNPQIFARLDRYCAQHRQCIEPTIRAFDREIQFYLSYLEYMEGFAPGGLPFCYPTITDTSKAIRAHEVFDLALASRLIREHGTVVTNDFELHGMERVLVVSGANQGGKSTFARTFGQLHYLASLGCPVAARDAKLFLFDSLFTHFERAEKAGNLSGKLEEELLRMHAILEQATARSILIMNESFGATTVSDSLFLNKEVLERIISRDMLCVCVTFLDELSTLDRPTVSMVSTVDPDNPTRRTFKILRQPADGRAYAEAIARKYRLTYRMIRERLAS